MRLEKKNPLNFTTQIHLTFPLKCPFKQHLKKVSSPYGKGGAGKKIVKILKKINLNYIKIKKFSDLNFK